MGEITDALKRARAARRAARQEEAAAPEASEPVLHPVDAPEPAEPEPEGEEAEARETAPVELARERRHEWPARAVVVEGQGFVAESFRHLALKVRSALERRGGKGIVVTGPLQAEGKTTVACNLALALASMSAKRSIALVDFDLRVAAVAPDLRIPAERGIEDVLRDGARLSQVRVAIEKPALDVYPCAHPCEAPHELLGGARLATIVRELERRYSVVVYDTPPALVVSDTRLILNHVGAWMGVARAGSTRERAFERMLDLLPTERFIGAALNEAALGPGLGTYSHYYYYHDRRRDEARGAREE